MERLEYFAGVDWGSETRQVCIVDGEGTILGERTFGHGGAGLAEMADWLVAKANAEAPVIGTAIETPHGPAVETPMERGFAVPLPQSQATRPVPGPLLAGPAPRRGASASRPSPISMKRHRVRRIDAESVLERLRGPAVPVAAGTTEAAGAHLDVVFSQLDVVGRQLARAYRGNRPPDRSAGSAGALPRRTAGNARAA